MRFANRNGFAAAASRLCGGLLLICLTGCTAPERTVAAEPSGTVTMPAAELDLDKNRGLLFHEGVLFTGASLDVYPDGQPAERTDYVGGIRHGFQRKWFADGLLSFERAYAEGKPHGETKSWWINGNLRSVGRYEHGVGQGFQEQWYKSGAKFKRLQLTDGRELGIQQSWRENGKLYNNYEARNGRIFGLKRANLCYSIDDEQLVLLGD